MGAGVRAVPVGMLAGMATVRMSMLASRLQASQSISVPPCRWQGQGQQPCGPGSVPIPCQQTGEARKRQMRQQPSVCHGLVLCRNLGFEVCSGRSVAEGLPG
jgi:hypothetical protein